MPADVTRRDLIGACGLMAVGGGPEDETLKAAAARSGRTFGAAVDLGPLQADPAFAAAILRECATLTPELSLKWDALEPAPGQWDFTRMDALAALARRRRRPLHGHALLWDKSTPDWAAAELMRDRDWAFVRRRLARVVGRYDDVVKRWDVVNEPVEPQHGTGGLRDSVFLKAFGPDYVRRALETARDLAPRAGLMINEYGLEYDDATDEDRRSRLLKLVDDLRRVGAPLDGIGLQSHLDLRRGAVSQSRIANFVGELAARGLFVLVTELDVKENDYTLPAAKRDAEVAATVRAHLDAVLDSPAVRGVTTWGLSDRHSWLQVTPADRARWPGAWQDGSDPGFNRGLPLDAALASKPMREAIHAAFRAAPPASASA